MLRREFGKSRGRGPLSDKIFKIAATVAGAYVLVVILLMVFQLGWGSGPIWHEEGIGFIWGTDWNAVEGRESFGVFSYIIGTLVTAAIAMVIGVPLSIGIAMFVLTAPKRIEQPFHNAFGDSIFLFSGTPFGLDVLSASIILAIMIIPTISAVSRDVMLAVPQQQKEAAYMLGSTTWEMFRLAVFPYSKAGLIGASILGLGRAIGETLAVTMMIGNATGFEAIPESLFAPSQTMPSIIANEFIEASPVSLHLPALLGIALVLLLVSMSINIVAHFLVIRMLKIKEGAINN